MMKRFSWLVVGLGLFGACVRNAELQDTAEVSAPSPTEKELALSGLRADDATAKVAGVQLVAMGEAVIPELRALVNDADPRVQARARDVLGQITGQWGGGEGIIWKRSVEDALHGTKPLLVLHLFGEFDEEHC
jgi:hypothetical protein